MRIRTIKFETDSDSGNKSGIITVDRFGETSSTMYFEIEVFYNEEFWNYRYDNFEDVKRMIFSWIY